MAEIGPGDFITHIMFYSIKKYSVITYPDRGVLSVIERESGAIVKV